jgi:hypothetical protein
MGGLWDDTGGYLADPEDEFIGKHANSHLVKTGALLTRQSGCIVLWGEPGMGKSQAVRSFLPTLGNVPLIALEFRDIPDAGRFERLTIETTAWRDWLAGNRGITLQREVQVQWDKRTDLGIRAVGLSGTNLRPLEITLEVKGCWHPKLDTAFRDQLVQD